MRPNWNRIGQLALGGQITRNVLVDGRVMDQVGATVFGIQDDNLTSEFLTNKVKRRDKVRIAANEDVRLDVRGKCIAKHFSNDVGIRALLLELHHMNAAAIPRDLAIHTPLVYGGKPCLVLVVIAENRLYSTLRCNRLKIEILRRCSLS